MTIDRRTTFQLGLLVVGLIVWGYGQKIEDHSLRLVGIAFFALATLLRFFRRSDTHHDEPAEDEEQ